ILSLAARAARAGAACLGLALLVLSGDPAAILGLLAVGALAVGGVVWTAAAVQPAWVRVLLLVSVLAAARIAAGTAAATLAAALLALGVLFRIRTEEVVLGLAAFGGIVAAVGRASPKLLLVSWTLGIVLVALRAAAGAARRAPGKLPLRKSEKAPTVL